jgi:hypothetical protein
MQNPSIAPAAPVVQIQQIRQAVPLRPATPRCEAQRIYSYFNDPKGKPLPQCEHTSSYVINGQHLCKRHAGDAALRILLEASAAKRGESNPWGGLR